MGYRTRTVLQVPEVCRWNSYIELAEQQLRAQGLMVARPGLCLDGPFGPPSAPPPVDPVPDIVHVHWPEMLAAWYGIERALKVLRELVDRGARLVQTVHDLHPHETSRELVEFLDEVDALTSGAHFFSHEHERQARLIRPKLPGLCTYLLHPAYPGDSATGTRPSESEIVLGCFGRIRPYKRYSEFAAAFADIADDGFRLLIAGEPLTGEIDEAVRTLATACPRITYVPGFASEDRYRELIGKADWIALPYTRVFSSGVLVSAIQAGRPVLTPRPTGARAYGLDSSMLVVDPWDDETAVRAWMERARQLEPPAPQGVLPTWEEAGQHLIDFYDTVIECGR